MMKKTSMILTMKRTSKGSQTCGHSIREGEVASPWTYMEDEARAQLFTAQLMDMVRNQRVWVWLSVTRGIGETVSFVQPNCRPSTQEQFITSLLVLVF